MVVTPTYHVFRMYIPFQDATYLPVELDAPTYEFADYSVPGISATAAVGTDGRHYLSVANLNPNDAADVIVALDRGRMRNAAASILTADAMDAHNTFDAPDTIAPHAFDGLALADGNLQLSLPAKSIVMVAFDD
jgi:alpha-N-arabinofuranosidase